MRRIHEGEGQYKETEEAIRGLLQEKGAKLSNSLTTDSNKPPVTSRQTDETYLGTRRASNFSGTPALGAANEQPFSHPASLKTDYWSLGGEWDVTSQTITAQQDATLRFKIAAKNVYVVGGSDSGNKTVTVLLNGKPYKELSIGESKLYDVLSFDEFKSGQTLELKVPVGVSLNAFTFGS